MNIQEAKEQIEQAVRIYLMKDEYGDYRIPIQQSVGEEFCQHDGVVTILMFYRRRASPKHRYIIIEDYGGGGVRKVGRQYRTIHIIAMMSRSIRFRH